MSGWRAAVDRRATAGVQDRVLGASTVYVMPNPSGLNAHVTVDDLADHFRTVAELAGLASTMRARCWPMGLRSIHSSSSVLMKSPCPLARS